MLGDDSGVRGYWLEGAALWGERVYGTRVGSADGNRVWITLPTERSGELPSNNAASLALESHLKSLMRDL